MLALQATNPRISSVFATQQRWLIAHMAHDKKVADGRIAFVLMRGIGDSFQRRDVPAELVRDCFLAAGAA